MSSIRIEKGKNEKALIEFARQTVKYQSGGLAAHIRLGHYKSEVPSENFLFAINMFRGLVDDQQGRLFILENSDLVFVYKGARPASVRSAIEKLRLLYSDVLQHAEKNHSGVEFCTWYNLSTDGAAFLALAEGMLAEVLGQGPALAQSGEGAPATTPGGVASIRIGGGEAPRMAGPGAELARLGQAADALERLDLGSMVRGQTVCLLRDSAAPEPVFKELYVSIPDLERKLMPVGRLAADRWLFQYFTRLLDPRMLSFLTGNRQRDYSSYFSINLNVASALLPEFAAFSGAMSDSARNSVVIEFQMLDVFSDLGTFFYVRDMARDYGFRICLDGLVDLSLPFVDRERLKLDLIKMRWRPDILKDVAAAQAADFHELVQRSDPSRVILCRADSESALELGRSLGIGLYQGHLVDRLLEVPAVA